MANLDNAKVHDAHARLTFSQSTFYHHHNDNTGHEKTSNTNTIEVTGNIIIQHFNESDKCTAQTTIEPGTPLHNHLQDFAKKKGFSLRNEFLLITKGAERWPSQSSDIIPMKQRMVIDIDNFIIFLDPHQG